MEQEGRDVFFALSANMPVPELQVRAIALSLVSFIPLAFSS